jgi:uracil-DNA glycosylase
MSDENFQQLLKDIKACTICVPHLPLGANPILQINPNARIVIAGQAPGVKAHQSSIPFNDASGQRLREWMGISSEIFYNPEYVAIVPMGFCYPGTGVSGDLPPRKECAEKWQQPILAELPNIQLTLVIGQHAQQWHLNSQQKENLTQTVRHWEEYWPHFLPLPHPSPRNNLWLKKNPWFETAVLPVLKVRIANLFN